MSRLPDWIGPKAVSVLTYLLAKGHATSASLRAGTGVSRRHVANVLTPYIDQGHVVARKGRGASFRVTDAGRPALEEALRKARGLPVRASASVSAERQTEVLQLLVDEPTTTRAIAARTGRSITSERARLCHLRAAGHVTRHGGVYWRLSVLGRARLGVEVEQQAGPWTRTEEARLMRLRSKGLTYAEIAEDMGRSIAACHQRASRLRRARRVVRTVPSQAQGAPVRDPRAQKMYMALEVGETIEQAAREAGYSCPDEAMAAARAYGVRLVGKWRLWRYDLRRVGEPARESKAVAA